MGVIVACVFLVAMFFFIPIPYGLHNEQFTLEANDVQVVTTTTARGTRFPHEEFVELIAALLSICCMILLGFADDVLDLRWRHKLLLPTMATLPLLMVYYVNYNSTTIIMPRFLRSVWGYSLDIGNIHSHPLDESLDVTPSAIDLLSSPLCSVSFYFRCRLLHLYGHAGRFLYECHQYSGGHQWSGSGSVTGHCHLHINLQWHRVVPGSSDEYPQV